MSEPTPTNGRVDSAVLNTKLDNLTTVVLQTNKRVEDVRTEQGEMRKDLAVYQERWVNHRKEHEDYTQGHADLHKRERGIFSGVILLATTISGTVSAWWNGR